MIIAEKKENSLFSIHNPVRVKLVTRLRLQWSNLNEHKFRHGFEDTISPMSSCNTEIESNEHFSCVAIFVLLKDKKSSIFLTKLFLLFLI